MNVSYKVRLFSGDGSTFLRPIVLKIPTCNTDTDSRSNESWTVGATYTQYGTELGSYILTQMLARSYEKVDFDLNTTYIASGFASKGYAFCGLANVISLDLLFLTPAVGSSIRFVFNNDNYIKMSIDSSIYAGWVLKFEFFTAANTLITTVYEASQGNTTSAPYENSRILPFPFALPNRTGAYTNTKIRFYGETSSYNGHLCISSGPFLIGGNGTDASDMSMAARSTTNFYFPAEYQTADIANWLQGVEPLDEDDPYQDIPNSSPSGPAEGTGIPESDPIDFPSLPTFSVTDTGFITLFNPTLGQVKDLADYMWNGLFDVNNFRKIFADPMDCILGFNMVPVAVPSGAAANINIGNIVTSVTMNIASSQWVELDCGSIDIGLPYGSYLDYSPYTKFSIYLPYIGTFDLSTDDVAGNALSLKYHVDTLSCSCVAYLKCGNHVLYQWTGACGYSIPVTQNDFSRMIMTIISIAAAGVGGAITAGAAGAGMVGMLGGAAKGAGESAAKNVMGLKPDVHRSGAIGSGAGLMGGQTPYLIIEIPNACKPKKQYHYTGYPGFITTTVGALSGYAEFESVILDGIGCTEEERGIIENLLMGGVYV